MVSEPHPPLPAGSLSPFLVRHEGQHKNGELDDTDETTWPVRSVGVVCEAL